MSMVGTPMKYYYIHCKKDLCVCTLKINYFVDYGNILKGILLLAITSPVPNIFNKPVDIGKTNLMDVSAAAIFQFVQERRK
jgi:hypothetical protein